ncbi:MAG: hypothetical protein ACP5RN_12445 [Armatimonadota bacterium]
MFGRWLKAIPPATALVAGLVLMLRPDTAWMFRAQISQLLRPADAARFYVGQGVYGDEENHADLQELYLQHLQTVASRHPEDYQAQLAVTLKYYPDHAESLLRLLPRFGDHPQLHAHILRFVTQRVRPRRPEADTMSITATLPPLPFAMGGPTPPGAVPPPASSPGPVTGPMVVPPPGTNLLSYSMFEPTLYDLWLRLFVPLPALTSPVKGSPPPSAYELATYIHIAEQGERLDPDNAYFPAMRAVLHFVAKQDDKAIDALLRASRKPRWEDYVNDEPESKIHLYTLAFGRQPAYHRVWVYFETLLPHFAAVHAAVRVAVYLAYQTDLAGNTERAAEIRLALIRLGRLMRTQGRHTITAQVGIAMSQTGCQTVPELRLSGFSPPDDHQKRLVEQRLHQMVDYLRRVGRTADIPWVERELRTGLITHNIIVEDTIRSRQDLETRATTPVVCWALNLMLLLAVFAVLFLWILFSAVSRAPVRLGYVQVFFLLSCLILLGVWAYEGEALHYAAESLKAPAVTAEQLKIFCSTFSSPPMPEVIAQILDWLSKYLWISIGDNVPSLRSLRIALWIGFEMFLLVLVALVAFWQVTRGYAGGTALVEGMRQSGLQMASVLFLLYALSLLVTARAERLASDMLHRIAYGKPHYDARLLGTKLPN